MQLPAVTCLARRLALLSIYVDIYTQLELSAFLKGRPGSPLPDATCACICWAQRELLTGAREMGTSDRRVPCSAENMRAVCTRRFQGRVAASANRGTRGL